jgi:CHAD domain-containing protein
MTSVRDQEPVKAACIFGVQRILPLLDAFLDEIEGVRSAQDIEYIHRMRVASRRLRAALPLFESCFPQKKFHIWMQELQKITRALGDARDTDVQIAFLLRLEKRKAQQQNKTDARSSASPAFSTSDLTDILLTQLQKKRIKLQNVVITALANLEKSGITTDMRTECTNLIKRSTGVRPKPAVYGIPPVAAVRISKRLDALMQYERWVYIQDAVAEHHAMRITAKKLRYTLEAYSPLYRRNLKKFLIRVKKIQGILGDLHDCDVWIDMVMAMLLEERSSRRTDCASPESKGNRVTGYRVFLSEREKERKQIYRRFVRYWESLGRAGIWTELRQTLTEGRKKRYRLHQFSSPETIRSALPMLSGQFPEGIPHSHTVTALALRIFDDLASLHRMQAHERFLLECACSLHDIGWKYGQKGHAKRSADMILSDDTIPVDILDRGMIGLISRAHRGKVNFESDGIFSLLSPEQQKNVAKLACLIRIADGLDDLHLGSVTSVHCKEGPGEVVIEITAIRDASAEIEKALQKGILFTQVFERALVIR